MNKRIKATVIFTFVSIIASVALAECTGYVVESGCTRCGFLYLEQKTYKKVTYYNSNPDGSCKTSSTTSYGKCGNC